MNGGFAAGLNIHYVGGFLESPPHTWKTSSVRLHTHDVTVPACRGSKSIPPISHMMLSYVAVGWLVFSPPPTCQLNCNGAGRGGWCIEISVTPDTPAGVRWNLKLRTAAPSFILLRGEVRPALMWRPPLLTALSGAHHTKQGRALGGGGGGGGRHSFITKLKVQCWLFFF